MSSESGRKSVLAIGIDPAIIDLSAMPGVTPDGMRAYLDAQINRISAFGYHVETCLIDFGDTAEEVVERTLRSNSFDCVVIGAGLRQPPELLLLFEKVINLVHAYAPQAKIAFNSHPEDTAEAAERWLAGSG